MGNNLLTLYPKRLKFLDWLSKELRAKEDEGTKTWRKAAEFLRAGHPDIRYNANYKGP